VSRFPSKSIDRESEGRILPPEPLADFQPSFRGIGGTVSWLERGCFSRRTEKLSVASVSVSGEQFVWRLSHEGVEWDGGTRASLFGI
jgi:hypothetical protein